MPLTARDIMTTEVHCVDPDLDLPDLERRFVEHGVSGFPVISRGQLVGIVTRSDVIRALAVEHTLAETASDWFHTPSDLAYDSDRSFEEVAERAGRRIDRLRVKDVMHAAVIRVPPDEPLERIAAKLIEEEIHRVVVADGDHLLGVISSLDFVRFFAEGRARAEG